MITFSANVTVSGTITFLGNAVNKGTINGNAVFKGTSQNGSGDETEAEEAAPPDGIINGNATFFDNALNMNRGDVTGTGTFNNCADNGGTVENEIDNRAASCPPSPFRGPYQDYNPPLIASWTFGSRGNGRWRRLVAVGSKNAPTILSTKYGRYQRCPANGSCADEPETYRAGNYAGFHYVLDPRVLRDINGNFVRFTNVYDGYCPPENYAKPLDRTDFFDCNGCIVEANGNVLADPDNPDQECSGTVVQDVQNLSASRSQIVGQSDVVILRWSPVSNIGNVQSYFTERQKDGGAWVGLEYWPPSVAHSSSNEHSVSAATDGPGTYTYRISVVRTVGTGQPSAPSNSVTIS